MLDMTRKSLFPDWEQKKLNFFEIFFKKKLRKCRIVPKNEKGDPLGSINKHSVAKSFGPFRFCRLRKKGKKSKRALCTKFALAGLGLSSLISFCKKWYIRDELCGLTKQKKTSLKEKAPTKNTRW